MSLERANEMVKHIRSMKNAKDGLTAKQIHEIAKDFNVKTHEVYHNWLTKSKAISYGKYLPDYLPESVINAKPKRTGRPKSTVVKTKNSAKSQSKVAKTTSVKLGKKRVSRKMIEELQDDCRIIEHDDFQTLVVDGTRRSSTEKYAPSYPTDDDIAEELSLMHTFM